MQLTEPPPIVSLILQAPMLSLHVKSYASENCLINLKLWKYNRNQSDIITSLKTTLIKIQIIIHLSKWNTRSKFCVWWNDCFPNTKIPSLVLINFTMKTRDPPSPKCVQILFTEIEYRTKAMISFIFKRFVCNSQELNWAHFKTHSKSIWLM